MTKQEALLSLAERCEAATGPDGALDTEIAYAVVTEGWGKHDVRWRDFDWPRYTSSLDAALTLVPEGREKWSVRGYDTNGVLAEHVRATAWVSGAPRVFAATPALALTAAALRSHAAGEGE